APRSTCSRPGAGRAVAAGTWSLPRCTSRPRPRRSTGRWKRSSAGDPSSTSGATTVTRRRPRPRPRPRPPWRRTMSELALKLLRALSAVPHRWLVVLGNLLGTVLYWLAAPRRRIARTNLRLCFPHLTEEERNAISRQHFRYFARSFFDRFVLWYQPADRIRALVQVHGVEHLEARAGKPVILLAPHFIGLDA